MSRRTYSGDEIITALEQWGFVRVGQSGSHVKLRYQHPVTENKRTVIVPLHEELATGTTRAIAEQAGAKDFQKFLNELKRLV